MAPSSVDEACDPPPEPTADPAVAEAIGLGVGPEQTRDRGPDSSAVRYRPLSVWMAQAVEVETAVAIMTAVLASLAQMHARAEAHGHLHPDLIFVGVDERGRYVSRISPFESVVCSLEEDASMSLYRAPEQLLGEDASLRGDLHAIGVMFYELLVGTLPWESSLDAEMRIERQLREPVPMLPSRAQRWHGFVQRLTDKHPPARFGDAREAMVALAKTHAPRDGSRRRSMTSQGVGHTAAPSALAGPTGERPPVAGRPPMVKDAGRGTSRAAFWRWASLVVLCVVGGALAWSVERGGRASSPVAPALQSVVPASIVPRRMHEGIDAVVGESRASVPMPSPQRPVSEVFPPPPPSSVADPRGEEAGRKASAARLEMLRELPMPPPPLVIPPHDPQAQGLPGVFSRPPGEPLPAEELSAWSRTRSGVPIDPIEGSRRRASVPGSR